MKRTFLALPVESTGSFLDVYEQIRSDLAEESIKWVLPANLHLTLFFFGSTSDDLEFRIKKAMGSFSQPFQSIKATFNQLGVFPSQENPRVLWAGVDDMEPFQKLFNKLTFALEMHDVAFERNSNFLPHLTLGRIKWIRNRSSLNRTLRTYQGIPLLETWLGNITYYQSILTPEGPIYKPLGVYPFSE